MNFDDGLRNLCNNAVAAQHIDGRLNDIIFQHLLFDRLTMADAAFSVSRKTDIVIMRIACMRSSARAAHLMFAIAADEFPGKNVVKNFLLAARRLLVFFVDGVHL